jgi:hypothetical protein
VALEQLAAQQALALRQSRLGILHQARHQRDHGAAPFGGAERWVELEIDLFAQSWIHGGKQAARHGGVPPDERFTIGEQHAIAGLHARVLKAPERPGVAVLLAAHDFARGAFQNDGGHAPRGQGALRRLGDPGLERILTRDQGQRQRVGVDAGARGE